MARGELFRSLQVRDFRTWWVGSLLSNCGTMIQFTTIPFVFHNLTGKGTWVAAASVVNILPMVLLGPVGGSLADRFSKRTILLVTQTLATLVSAVFGTLWLVGVRSPWAYLVVAGISGSVSGINLPSWQAIIGDLVPPELMMNAVTLNSTQFNASRALGPAIGGVALAELGAAWCFYLNTASYAFVLYALIRLRRRRAAAGSPSGARTTVRDDIRTTLRTIRVDHALRNAIITVSVVSLLGYPIPSLIVFFQEDVYHAPRWVLGLLTASIGIGAISVAPYIAGRGRVVAPSRLIGPGLVLYAVAAAFFGVSLGPVTGAVALFALGAAHLAVTSALFTVVQLGVDPSMRGKVIAGYLMVLNVATMVGSLGLGAMIDVVGPRATVAGGGLVFLVASLWLVAARALQPFDAADAGRTAAAAQPAAVAGSRPG